MKLIAHRGLKTTKIKENTLASFLNAINDPNFSGFEFDIRETKNKKYIINHNANIKTDIISTKTLKELKQKYSLITLDTVLSLHTDKIFLIEIKDLTTNVLALHQILKKYSHQKLYVMSFHNSVIAELKKLNPSYKLGILNYLLNSEENYQYDFICLLNNLTTQNLINLYHKRNCEVFIYGLLNDSNLKYQNVYYIVDKLPK